MSDASQEFNKVYEIDDDFYSDVIGINLRSVRSVKPNFFVLELLDGNMGVVSRTIFDNEVRALGWERLCQMKVAEKLDSE